LCRIARGQLQDGRCATALQDHTMTSLATLSLTANLKPAADDAPMTYALRLTNSGATPIAGFRLCVSGPARIDPQAEVEGAVLDSHVSNHAEFSPPDGFVLEGGASWAIVVRGLGFPMRHWTDGVTAAYVVLGDGAILPVMTAPTEAVGDNAPLLRGTARFPVPAPGMSPVPVSIVPWPKSVAVTGARPAPAGLDLQPEGEAALRAASAFAALVGELFAVEGLVRPVAEGGLPVRLADRQGLGAEAYELSFAADTVEVRAASQTGFLYGLVTLGQMLRGARLYPGTFSFPTGGTIADAPAMSWRGTHLDVARQFYSSAEISRFLRVLAWNKLNRFHWHLSDDEAWRVEIDAYPALTEIGAWRGHGLPIPALLGSGGERSGGYYSKAAVREIVALGESLGIAIVPEIDVPGHCFAMLQAIPELRDPDEQGLYHSVQAFPNNCLNPGNEAIYPVIETIFDELIELFPSKLFHIGADEVPLGAWSGSPMALEKLKQVGGEALAAEHARRLNQVTNHEGADHIEGTGAAVLQAEFLGRIQAFLASRGCVTGGWEEAAHGDRIDKRESYLVGWRTVESAAALAGQGYDMVVAPGQRYYLDMANSPAWSEPGAGWAGWSGPEETYAFDPVAGWSAEQRQHLLGVQACIWSEPMTDRAVFDRLVFPRLSAIAETGWTTPENKSWRRFNALVGLMPILYGHRAE
jgi:hexosaminidase